MMHLTAGSLLEFQRTNPTHSLTQNVLSLALKSDKKADLIHSRTTGFTRRSSDSLNLFQYTHTDTHTHTHTHTLTHTHTHTHSSDSARQDTQVKIERRHKVRGKRAVKDELIALTTISNEFNWFRSS